MQIRFEVRLAVAVEPVCLQNNRNRRCGCGPYLLVNNLVHITVNVRLKCAEHTDSALHYMLHVCFYGCQRSPLHSLSNKSAGILHLGMSTIFFPCSSPVYIYHWCNDPLRCTYSLHTCGWYNWCGWHCCESGCCQERYATKRRHR